MSQSSLITADDLCGGSADDDAIGLTAGMRAGRRMKLSEFLPRVESESGFWNVARAGRSVTEGLDRPTIV